MSGMASAPARNITLSWLLRLRWGAVAGQSLTVGLATLVLGLDLPVVQLMSAIAVTVLTNVALERWLSTATEAPPSLIASVLVLDTLLLTLLLFLAGGPQNPFSALYLVHVTLAAVTLGARWGWAVLGLSVACFSMLFAVSVPLHSSMSDAAIRSLTHRGSWFAFVVAGTVTAYFVSRITAELQRRDRELAEAQARYARGEKLASLTTLAAGAAHELGTPLGTIAVVARELERGAEKHALAPAVADDLRLIREQVERCRLILVQMGAKAGEATGEAIGEVAAGALIADVRAALGADRSARFEVAWDGAATVLAPRQALVQVLASLVRNAFDASPRNEHVRLEIHRIEARITLKVIDRGHGMAPDVLSRAGDPFFTTKPAGQGTGLGLFLARALAERLGGSLALDSQADAGTTALLQIPQPVTTRSPT